MKMQTRGHNIWANAWYCVKMVNAKGEAVYFNRAWKHGKETWVVQGIGETLVIGRDRQKRRSRTFTQLPQAEKYLARMGFKAAP